MSLSNIQQMLDELDPAGTLTLERGDYAPCVINKPMNLHCDGATFWTNGDVPSIAIRSASVVIKDASLRGLTSAKHVVLAADPDCHPLLQNIRVFGRTLGVEAEPSEWILPPAINVEQITPNHPGFYLDLGVPQRSQIVCRISGVSMDPAALSPGVNSVKLQIHDAMVDSILIGEVEIIGPVLTRLIPFFARVSATASSAPDGNAVPLFEVSIAERERFQKLLAGEPRTVPTATVILDSVIVQPQTTKVVKPKKKSPPVQTTVPVSTIPFRTTIPPDLTNAPLQLGGAFAAKTLRKLPVYVLVDCSNSMDGDPIASVPAGISALPYELMNDPTAAESAWISIITFNSSARQVVPLTPLAKYRAPTLAVSDGRTLGSALQILCDALERELTPADASVGQKGDWRPIVFLLTCGPPTDEWESPAATLKSKFAPTIIAIACGDGADLSCLTPITTTVLHMNSMSPNGFSRALKWDDALIPHPATPTRQMRPVEAAGAPVVIKAQQVPKQKPLSEPGRDQENTILGSLFQNKTEIQPATASTAHSFNDTSELPVSDRKPEASNGSQLSKLFKHSPES